MDIRTPCLILLGLLLAAISLSVLGLAADNVAYVNKHQDAPVHVHYMRWNETAQAQYSYWVTIDYVPSRFSMGTTNAMIGAGVVCAVIGAGIAVASCFTRGSKALKTGFSFKKQERSVPFLPTSLVFTTIAFLVSLAVAIYVWHPVMRWSINFHNSLPFPKSYSQSSAPGPLTYQSPFEYTPEVWNCFLYPYVVEPAQSKRLHSLCREAGIAKYLMVPVVVLSAILLSALLWTWRQARIANASEAQPANGKEVEEVSVQGQD